MSRVERTEAGFVVDADLLAAAFRLPAASVRALMRDGRITSRCEAGVGEDEGRWRLSFYHGGRVCRLTVGADGTLIGRATFPAPTRVRETPARTEERTMKRKFRIGDHVSWNSEAGRVSGTIIAVHTEDFDYKGHTHHASQDDPQYEIKSDKTDHVAAHKGSALERVG